MADKEKSKSKWQSRKKKAVVKEEGEGIGELTREKPPDVGQFRISKKTLNKETEEWEYEFEWDEKFARYAQSCSENPEELTREDMDNFCLNILIASQTDQLEDGVKVSRVDTSKENKRRFYKKYD